ncbi:MULTISPECIES: acyclic terpene utilization AtuA family protein [Sphingomonadaceae]|uniref:acyclic terpene utilization AtuA family protein n=1 Tax=Sphingomonadales TaxID=204457 RepID=UPI0028AD86EE|nr:acyclic terpene utilization AtuA family protein [Sphingobium yanoikuyae]
MSRRTISIGGASGFWGDSSIALPQLLQHDGLDYISFDYLAEVTMSILARARAKDASLGYATDFVALAARHLPQIAERGVKLIANAGGVNPVACAQALRARIADAGLDLRVGVVTGDDLLPMQAQLQDCREMFSDAEMPARLLSLNAYLGAAPIAAALGAGADIVVTGRCVDSATVLGACIHEFGWSLADFDRLSGGSLAGHIVECGAQATGGLFTDWQDVSDWANIGYPIAVIEEDGAFEVTKPAGTGGLISRGTVSEQLVYEIGDPAAYLLPDVTCDWRSVKIEETGKNRVRVSGAIGRAPPETYKASATWQDGYRVGATWTIIGEAAAGKAAKVGEAVVSRVASLLTQAGAAPFTETSIEILGAESSYGASSQARGVREVVLKIAAKHVDPKALEMLVREFTSAGTSMAPGFTGMGGNRPKVMPLVRLFSIAVDKMLVDGQIHADVDGQDVLMPPAAIAAPAAAVTVTPEPDLLIDEAELIQVPLIALAWGRSGDKGNHANIGIVARRAEYLPYIKRALQPERVAKLFDHYAPTEVKRFDLPGIQGLNFMLYDVLGGGGIASLRNDPQGKGYAQILLGVDIAVPSDLLAS